MNKNLLLITLILGVLLVEGCTSQYPISQKLQNSGNKPITTIENISYVIRNSVNDESQLYVYSNLSIIYLEDKKDEFGIRDFRHFYWAMPEFGRGIRVSVFKVDNNEKLISYLNSELLNAGGKMTTIKNFNGYNVDIIFYENVLNYGGGDAKQIIYIWSKDDYVFTINQLGLDINYAESISKKLLQMISG